jgi:hypothetical protein
MAGQSSNKFLLSMFLNQVMEKLHLVIMAINQDVIFFDEKYCIKLTFFG